MGLKKKSTDQVVKYLKQNTYNKIPLKKGNLLSVI